MTQREIEQTIRSIGLALSVVHNCVVTDDVEAVVDDKSWRIDHTKELELLGKLADFLSGNPPADCSE